MVFIFYIFFKYYIYLYYQCISNFYERKNSYNYDLFWPSSNGIVFMGAIVLLEKSQRVLNSLAVSPVKVSEYILSKVISLGVISSIVAMFIAITLNLDNIIISTIGTFFLLLYFLCLDWYLQVKHLVWISLLF